MEILQQGNVLRNRWLRRWGRTEPSTAHHHLRQIKRGKWGKVWRPEHWAKRRMYSSGGGSILLSVPQQSGCYCVTEGFFASWCSCNTVSPQDIILTIPRAGMATWGWLNTWMTCVLIGSWPVLLTHCSLPSRRSHLWWCPRMSWESQRNTRGTPLMCWMLFPTIWASSMKSMSPLIINMAACSLMASGTDWLVNWFPR